MPSVKKCRRHNNTRDVPMGIRLRVNITTRNVASTTYGNGRCSTQCPENSAYVFEEDG